VLAGAGVATTFLLVGDKATALTIALAGVGVLAGAGVAMTVLLVDDAPTALTIALAGTIGEPAPPPPHEDKRKAAAARTLARAHRVITI